MRIISLLIMIILLSSIVYSMDLFRFSGTVSVEETASEFCARQSIKECNKADYLDNEVKNPKDCRLVSYFDVEGCRDSGSWYNCYKKSKEYVCIERGAD